VRLSVIVALGLAVAGCSAPVPSGTPFPGAPSPTASALAAGQACDVGRLVISTGGWGGAGGTEFVVLHVELASGPPCLLPDSPAVSILDGTGAVLASGGPLDAATVDLVDTTDLRLGWSSFCAAPPAGALRARVTISGGSVEIPLPQGFVASCQGVATQVYVEPILK
jgi:hypothetical protein